MIMVLCNVLWSYLVHIDYFSVDKKLPIIQVVIIAKKITRPREISTLVRSDSDVHVDKCPIVFNICVQKLQKQESANVPAFRDE